MKINLSEARDEIVETARELFAKFGFKKTTMEEVAKALKKAKSSLYYYFKSKEQIFQAVIEQEANLLREKISKAIEQETTPQGKLRAYMITRMRALKQLANFYSALKDEYLENYGFIEKFRKKYDEEEMQAIKNMLQEGIDKRIFDIKDIDITATAILIALKGFESWVFQGNIKWTEKDIDNLINILFHGIVKR